MFLNKDEATQIEEIRTKYNPLQRQLIDSHVTLCREDELVMIDRVLNNLEKLKHKKIVIEFGQPIRFENGKGVLISGRGINESFQKLRRQILTGTDENPRQHKPHITLLHPRNAICTDTIFNDIASINLPAKLSFPTILLIEQVAGRKWAILQTFDLAQ